MERPSSLPFSVLPLTEAKHNAGEYTSHQKHPPDAECLIHSESPTYKHIQGYKCDKSQRNGYCSFHIKFVPIKFVVI